MIIKKNIFNFILNKDLSIKESLKIANDRALRTFFVVDEHNFLIGVVSSGDIGKWLSQNDQPNLLNSIEMIANKKYIFSDISDTSEMIEKKFTSKIDIIPILDKKGHLKSLAFNKNSEINIGNFRISEDTPAFVIAEIGNNHNGSIDLAKKLVDLAAQSGADCVKFQMRDLESLYVNSGNSNDASEDLGSQYVLDLLSKFSLSKKELIEVFDHCKEKNILPLCTPWDIKSLEILEEYDMCAYKVSSADLTNVELLERMSETKQPLIISTGMSTEDEIKKVVNFLNQRSVEYIFLHCNSTYPTPYKDVNLKYLNKLKAISGFEVGYSGHERGYHIPLAAITLGAKIIEKHFTVDKNMEGNDHKVSLLPNEFNEMVKCIRDIEESMGIEYKSVTQGEMINRETLAKSIVASCPIKKGEVIQKSMLKVKSPGKGLQPIYINDLIGKVANRDINENDFFYTTDIKGIVYKPKHFNFNLKWGIPVRFHDYKDLIKDIKPDILEFHLSYKDLEVTLKDYMSEHDDIGLVVHSPELFSNDHILDLASNDEEYNAISVNELQKVVDKTLELKKYFKSTKTPCIVTNMGGFTTNNFIDVEKRQKMYNTIKNSLAKVNCEGVEIIAQTMPPFPWHFGGQSYHNLFMDPDEIVDFCKENNFRICLDVSHTKLACNYFKWDFDDFIIKVSPYIAHLHIVDAKGIDDEGIQIGTGEINFNKLGKLFQKYTSNSSFIPEIWQGHKNNGEGFWEALYKLEECGF